MSVLLDCRQLLLGALLVTTGLLGLAPPPARAATGAAFLKIPNGAAEIALGMSGVSHARGGSAVWWNPALLARGERSLGLQFFRWLGDGRGTFGTMALSTAWGGLGAYLFDLGTPGFEARERPGPAEGTFTLHQSIAALAAAARLPFGLAAGFAAKGYIEEIYGDVAVQFPLLDLGTAWTGGRWTVGATAGNLNASSDRTDDPAPVSGRIGAARRDRFGDVALMNVAELSFVRGQSGAAHIGVEAAWKEHFYLRAGLAASRRYIRPTFGLGLQTGGLSMDAAMALYDDLLGSIWRVGLGYKL